MAVNQEGRGERLITEQGERTPYLEKLMGFLQELPAEYSSHDGLR